MAAGQIRFVSSLMTVPAISKKFTGGTTGAAGDLVVLKAGALAIAGAAEPVLGLLEETMSSSNYPLVNITPNMAVLMDSSSTGIVSTDPGKFFDLTGGTGAQAIDISTRDTTYSYAQQKVFTCLEFQPSGYISGTSMGIYRIRQRQ